MSEDFRQDPLLLSRGIVRAPNGDYLRIPRSSIQYWEDERPRLETSPMAADPIQGPEPEEGVQFSDYARSIMAGGAQIAQGVGWLTRMAGAEDVGSAIEQLGTDAVDYWNEGLSDAAKDSLSREFVRKNEGGDWEWGDANIHTVGLFGAQSLLGTAAGAGVGAGVTKVLQTFANPFGRAALTEAIERGTGAMQAAAAGDVAAQGLVRTAAAASKKLQLVDKVLGAGGFGLGEGAIGGMSAGVNVYQSVLSLPPDKLLENDRYQQVFASTDEKMPELERHQYAAETVAREASSLAGLQAGLTTALLGAPMGAFFGSILGKKALGAFASSTPRAMLTGAGGEAAQEFAQGATEQLISNRQLQRSGADVELFDGVLNQAIGGAVAGAPLGGALGAMDVDRPAQTTAKERTKNAAPKSKLEPLRAAATEAFKAGVPQEEILQTVERVKSGEEPVLVAVGKLRKRQMGFAGAQPAADFSATQERLAEEQAIDIAEEQGIAKAEQQLARTLPDAKSGAETTITGDKPLRAQYQLVDVNTLVTSHDIDGRANAAFPQELQPRDRSRSASRQWIEENTARFQHEPMIEGVEAGSGPPVVDSDGIVESGNGRVNLLRNVYAKEKGAGYKAYLKAHAARFGIDPADVEKMDTPVLVRARQDALSIEDRIEFTRAANRPTVASLSPAERARTDAASLDDDQLARLNVPDDGNVLAAQNGAFVSKFLQSLPATERGGLLTAEGEPTKQVAERIKGALFAKAYKDDRLLALMAEDADPDVANVVNALVKAAPAFAKVDDAGFDVAGPLVEGVETLRAARKSGQAVDEFLRQQGMFSNVSAEAGQVASFLSKNARSAKRMSEALVEIAKYAEAASNPTGDLLGDPLPKTFDAALKAADRRMSERYPEKIAQGALFSRAPVSGRIMRTGQVEDRPGGGVELDVSDAVRPLAARLTDGAKQRLAQRYRKSAEIKPQFDATLKAIADEHGGSVNLSGLKGLDRAVEKLDSEYGGDPRKLKDLVRGTIVVDTPEQAQAVYRRLQQRFQLVGDQRLTLLDPNAEGYADIKVNTVIDGETVEIQVNTPEMIAAKARIHGLYKVRQSIERRAAAENRALTAKERKAKKDTLEGERSGYAAALDAFRARSSATSASNSARLARASTTSSSNLSEDTSAPLRSTDVVINRRGGSVSKAQASPAKPPTSLTGKPSTEKNLSTKSPPTAASVAEAATDSEPEFEDVQEIEADEEGVVRDLPEFSRAAAAPRRTINADLENEIRSALRPSIDEVRPLINVRVLSSPGELGLDGNIEGAYVDGQVVLFANTLRSPERAREVFAHEVFGHFAMERTPFGKEAVDMVLALHDKKHASIEPLWDEVGVRWGTHLDRETRAKEVIAVMAERGDKHALMTRLIAGVRRFLRKLGIVRDYSDAEVRDLIARAARALRVDVNKALADSPKLQALNPGSSDADILAALDEAIPPDVVAIDSYLSRGPDQTQTPAFKQWFGDSKVTDEKGEPLRVYHGTYHDFDMFERGPNAGMFFTSDPTAADEYAERGPGDGSGSVVYPIYLALKNPLIIDAKGADWRRVPMDELGPDYVGLASSTNGVMRTAERVGGYDGLIVRNVLDRISSDKPVDVYVATKPTQIKSAIGNSGAFDPKNPDIRFSRAAPADPAIQAIMDRVLTKAPEEFTVKDRARRLWDDIRNTQGLAVKQGLIDSFASIEALERDFTGGQLLDASQSAHKAMLATKNLPSVMAAVMMAGAPEFRNGTFMPVAGRKGIVEIFKPLTEHRDGNLLRQWELFAAANRANRLIKEKNPDGTRRENLFTQDEIDTALTLEQRYPEFRAVLNDWNAFNKQVLDLAQDSGLIDPAARAVWEKNDYVPFYRAIDEFQSTGPRNRRGVAGQRADIKTLKGEDKALGNVFENMMMNTAHLIDAAFKNRAMQRVVGLGIGAALQPVPFQAEAIEVTDDQLARALTKAGLIVGNPVTGLGGLQVVQAMTPSQKAHWSTIFRRVAPKGPNIVSVMQNGKPEYYEVTDPLVLSSITGMGYDNFADVWGLFRGSKKLLTSAVTADPAFMMANWVRDTLSTWVTSDASMHPFIDAIKGAKAALTNDPALVQMMMAGAGGGGFYDSNPEDIRKLIATKVPIGTKGFKDSVVDSPRKAWHVWRKIGSATENANRIAVFKAVLARGGTVAEAAYQARDVLNFSMSGDYAAMRWLTQSVPFLNARVQGLYRLFRGARDNKKGFFLKGTMLLAATMALAMRNNDREEYEELSEWDKDLYWHIFAGGEHFRIPKPFEVGAMFATVPERVWRAASGRDSAKILWQRIFQMAADTFAFNPVPQLVKPIVEQYANRSMFTGSPIVGMAEQKLEPEAQFTPWTSETMRALADALPGFAPAWLRSPARLEAALRAYTGTMGMYVLDVSDAAVREALGYPETPGRKIYDMPVVKRFLADPNPRHTKYADQMYEMLDQANATFSTINRLRREQRFEEATELQTRNKSKLAVRVRLNRLGTQVRNINTQIRLVQLDRTMSAKDKRARVDALIDRKNKLTRQVAPWAELF